MRVRIGVHMALVLLASCRASEESRRGEIAKLISSGMATQAAVLALTGQGFACSHSSDTQARFDCSRMTQHIIPPYTCIERVRFTDAAGTVAVEEIPPLACAGL